MKTNDFNKSAKKFLDECYKLLTEKQVEYTMEDDRFDYFKKAASIQSTTPERACANLLSKHIISLYDMTNGNKDFTLEKRKEKLTDIVCYIALLNGMYEESYCKELCNNEEVKP